MLHSSYTRKLKDSLQKTNYVKLSLVFLSILMLFTIYYCHSIPSSFLSLLNKLQFVSTQEALICFCSIYIVSNLFFVPIGLPLNLFAGMLWGALWGGILINLLAMIVASISFLIARLLGQYFLDNFFSKFSVLRKFNHIFNRNDWQFIFAMRVNPIVPFGASNYLFGLVAGLSFNRYIFATMLGNFIPCFAFSAVGATLKTFSLEDTNVRKAFLKIGLMLVLLSMMFLVKWIVSNRQARVAQASE